MATQKIGIDIVASDGGSTRKLIKDASELKTVLDAAASSASRLGSGTSGSRAVAARAAPAGSERMMSGQEYGQMRGTSGLTGASARDFANQAQGLGGLVRLYATYAANVFAVGAAFTALKNAADTTNLVRGLDTLGATSGRNLGALSKQLVAATDGAISLRDAMSATAMTSSAGMTNENIRRLAGVAKTASLALGVSMPDALNRLSRGITKLEPELLDELGLFTKIGPATEKYALEIGKTVSQLTDFERRQAFANAVIAEGEQKFSALAEAAANPYDKLLASLKNVAQTGLELVNTVLVPIVSLLSQNPTALGAGLLAVASLVVKQALPAIGQIKEGLKSSADIALAAAKNKAGDAVQAREQLNKLIEAKVEASADFELQKFEELEAQLTGMREKGLRKRGALYKILEKDIVDITDKELKAAEKSVKALEGRAKQDPRVQQVAELERATLNQLKNAISAEDQLVATKLKNRQLVEEQLEKSGQLAKIQRMASDYELKAKKDAIIANTAYNSSLLGIGASWQLFRAQVEAADLKLKTIPATILLIRGAMASLTSVVVALGAAINKAFFIISIVATAFSVLDGLLSKGAKQVQAFDSAIDSANDSVDNVKRTLDALKDSRGIEQSTIQTTLALSNAMTELADTSRNASKAMSELDPAIGNWDKGWDWIKGFVGKDRASELSKTIARQITSAIDLLSREGLDAEFETEVKKILNVSSLTLDDLTAAYKRAEPEQRAALDKLFQSSKTSLGNINSELQKFKESGDAAFKAYREFLQSTLDTNPLFKLGESLIGFAHSMQMLADSTNSVDKAFQYLVDNPERAAMFGTEAVSEFVALREEFTKQKAAIDANSTALRFYEKQLQSAQEASDSLRSITEETGVVSVEIDSSKISGIKEAIANLRKQRLSINTSALDRSGALFSKMIESALQRGMEYASKALREAQVAAGAAIAKASAAALTGPRRIEAEAAIQRQQLQAQLDNINSTQELIGTQDQLTAELRLANALAQKQLQKDVKDANLQSKLDSEIDFAKAGAKLARGMTASLEGFDADQQASIRAQVAAQQLRNQQQQAARARVGGELAALNISTSISGRRSEQQEQAELANSVNQVTKQYSDQLGILQNIAGVTNLDLIAQQSAIELAQLQAKQLNDVARIQLDINLAQERANASSGLQQELYLKEVSVLKGKKALLETSNRLELDNKGLQDRAKLQQRDLDQINKRFELSRAAAETEKAFALGAFDVRAQELDLISSGFGLSQEVVANRKAALETDRATLELSLAIDQANMAMAQKREEADRRIADIRASGSDNAAKLEADITAELARQQALNNLSIAQLSAQYNSKIAIIDATKQINVEQERYNLLLDNANVFAESLKDTFGQIGESLGAVATALAESVVNSEKRAKAERDVQKAVDKAWESMDYSAVVKAEEDLAKQKKKNAREEMADDIRIVNSSKKLFKEKTAAYKLLSGLEKVMHITRLAMEAKELAVKISSLATGTAAKAGAEAADTSLTFAGTVARLPAYAAEIYGKTIGQLGPILGPAVATALVAAMFGLFGRGGKGGSQVFTPNSEQLQQTQGTGQTWNSMGQRVSDVGGILGDDEAKANSIVKSLQILQDNSFKSLDYDNRLLRSFQNVADAIGKATNTVITSGLRTVSDKIALMLGTRKEGGFGSSIPLIGKALSSIFGGGYSESSSLQSQRLELSGTFANVATDINSGLRQVTDVLVNWQKDGGWFGSDKSGSYIQQISGTVPEDIKTVFTEVFNNLKSGYETIADLAGIQNPIGFVAEKLNAVRLVDSQGNPLKFDYTGLKGDEIRTELEAYFSKINNIAIQALFPEFTRYQQAGEDYGTTVIRVIQNTNEVSNAFKAIGKTFAVTGTAAYSLSNDLVKLAGGLENFVDQAKFFADNFLTAVERAIPVQKAVVDQLTALGFSSVDTKDEFKALVQSLDLTDARARTTYQSLMELAPGFIEVLDAVEEQSAPLQETAQRFRDFAKEVRDFRNSLVLGSLTTLTPQQKYAEAQAQFESIYAQALAGDSAAMSKVNSSAQAFLEASRSYFASSETYARDFASVLDKLEAADISASASASVAELQLNALSVHTTLLTSINENIATIAGVPAMASGGLARGLTLVGELGPELVDFSTPGRVYTADQTQGMFTVRASSNQGAVVAELQQLRQELTQLRKEQQKQTGDLIISNYDANQKASEAVADAVIESTSNLNWDIRTQPQIK